MADALIYEVNEGAITYKQGGASLLFRSEGGLHLVCRDYAPGRTAVTLVIARQGELPRIQVAWIRGSSLVQPEF